MPKKAKGFFSVGKGAARFREGMENKTSGASLASEQVSGLEGNFTVKLWGGEESGDYLQEGALKRSSDSRRSPIL